MILRIQGKSPDRTLFGPGIFFPDSNQQGENMVITEKTLCKMTIYQIKDWDTYQMVIREII